LIYSFPEEFPIVRLLITNNTSAKTRNRTVYILVTADRCSHPALISQVMGGIGSQLNADKSFVVPQPVFLP
jgi:hypothetical protein